MGASLKVDVSRLKTLIANMNSTALRQKINRIMYDKGVAALIGQAVADNFAQEGPGWEPLKAGTIRSSVRNKTTRKALSMMTDKEILRYEKKARIVGAEETPNRAILQRTGMLKKASTIPDYKGAKGGNVYRIEGKNLVWGVDLKYARIHNQGGIIKNGFGKGIRIRIPKREFLKLSDEWRDKVYKYILKKIATLVNEALKGAK